MAVPWRRREGRASRYAHLDEDSTRRSYQRNLIIIVISGLAMGLALLSSRFCGNPQETGRILQHDQQAIALANSFARSWPDFLFDVSARRSQNRKTFAITVMLDREAQLPGNFIASLERSSLNVLGQGDATLAILIRQKGRARPLAQHRTTLVRIREQMRSGR